MDVRSTSVSLVIAWKIAAGGETGVSATITSGNLSGSQLYLAELNSHETGHFVELGSASNNSNESNVVTTSSGTTAAAVGPGVAYAMFAVDSVLGDATASFSNGFVSEFSQPTGNAETGFWLAVHNALQNSAYETSITRAVNTTTLVPDQMSGGIVILGMAPDAVILPAGILSAETFGTAYIPGPINPAGIATANVFGVATVANAAFITPGGIASLESFGGLVVSRAGFVLQAFGIATAETFGSHVVTAGARRFFMGGTRVNAVYLGSSQVFKAYVGATAAW